LIESLLLTSKGIVLNFEHLDFGFVSDFDIRISDLSFLVPAPLVCVRGKMFFKDVSPKSM